MVSVLSMCFCFLFFFNGENFTFPDFSKIPEKYHAYKYNNTGSTALKYLTNPTSHLIMHGKQIVLGSLLQLRSEYVSSTIESLQVRVSRTFVHLTFSISNFSFQALVRSLIQVRSAIPIRLSLGVANIFAADVSLVVANRHAVAVLVADARVADNVTVFISITFQVVSN